MQLPQGAMAAQESSWSLLRKWGRVSIVVEKSDLGVSLQTPVLVFINYGISGKFPSLLKPHFPHL